MFKKFKYLLILAACFISAYSEVFTYEQALTNCDALNLHIQSYGPDGRTHTLNKKGAASASFDYAMRAFLKFSKGKEVLEIGGCYGDVMLQALKQSKDTKYVLSDLDARHLFIAAKCLAEKIQQNWLESSSANQVKFAQADITDACEIQKLGLHDAIYVGEVFHFLTPDQLELAVKHLCLLLKPKGRVYVTALSPYLKHHEKFILEYERRVKSGEKYPGFIKSLRDYIKFDEITPLLITSTLDGTFLFLDLKTLKEVFENNGFKVLECKFVPLSHKSKLWSYDGREYVIIIAEKDAAPLNVVGHN